MFKQGVNRMKEIKAELIAQDREKAAFELTKMIHYVVSPRACKGEEYVLFKDDKAIREFVLNTEVTSEALSWLLRDLKDELMITSCEAPIALTERGVERFC